MTFNSALGQAPKCDVEKVYVHVFDVHVATCMELVKYYAEMYELISELHGKNYFDNNLHNELVLD